MNNTNISKRLDAILSTATFSALKLGATQSFEDILFIELLTHHDTLCYEYLSSRLDEWQLQQVEMRVRRFVEVPYEPSSLSLAEITPDQYYRDMLQAIAMRFPQAKRLSTLHVLHFVLSDSESATSRAMALFGVTASSLNYDVIEYSAQNNMAEMFDTKVALDIGIADKSEVDHPLSKYGTDLTALASNGKLDKVIGRDRETQHLVEVLSRRKKNNPILIGEAGVGKSAIVEGLAIKMVAGEVPHTILGKRLFSIDIAALIAGTKFRGEFEERINNLVNTMRESRDAILFIDEIHTIMGAGATQGSLDVANILKPALARGEIQTIGATTIDEYRTHIECDSALERRMQRVVIEPTTVEQSIDILRQIANIYEKHHRVIYTDEAIVACVTLAERYINDRHLPDKAIDLLDEAGAKANIAAKGNIVEIARGDIERIITANTGIVAEQLSTNEMIRLRSLEEHLNSRVIGQPSAVNKIARAIRRARSGVASPNRPIGVFMFVGPTGVGKTLLAKELSQWMFGNSQALIRFDMSEYSHSHNVSRLVGSPPGYVGYGEGGELTERVRLNPHSVILFDEIEKAHPDIYNIMLQIFDEGRLTDGMGRLINFRNTIIIMTSNVGSQGAVAQKRQVGYATISQSINHQIATDSAYRNAIKERFSPEFINRLDDTLTFRSLEVTDIERIIDRELEQITSRIASLGYIVRVTPSARLRIAAMVNAAQYGARALHRQLIEIVEEPISDLIIDGGLKRGATIVVEHDRSKQRCGVRLKVA
ncbi:MAG: ATP-dependent Clp protease ATP-binding subunit [Rikenellaceae bacterium]